MSKRGPDYQKREAKNLLWMGDGQHNYMKTRGKARCKDYQLIRAELHEAFIDAVADEREFLEADLDRAWLCSEYGICDVCNPQNEESHGVLLESE